MLCYVNNYFMSHRAYTHILVCVLGSVLLWQQQECNKSCSMSFEDQFSKQAYYIFVGRTYEAVNTNSC